VPNPRSAEKPSRKFAILLFPVGLSVFFECCVDCSAMQMVWVLSWGLIFLVECSKQNCTVHLGNSSLFHNTLQLRLYVASITEWESRASFYF